MYTYQIISLGLAQSIIRTDTDGAVSSVPFEPANADYQHYSVWVAEGNVAVEITAAEIAAL